MDLPNYWVVTTPAAMGNDLAGLRNPDVVTALVIDGYSTDDGKAFDKAPFARGATDAIFMVLDAEVGQKVYERMANYIKGRVSLKENLENDNEVVAGKWDLGNNQVALLVADGGGIDAAQSAFETALGLEGVLLQRSNKAVMSAKFDASAVLQENKEVFGEEARQALSSLAMTVTPAPKKKRGPRA